MRNWKDLPPNSVIVVDECQRFMPSRRAGDPPAWVRDLSVHRHLGLDFIFITQHPALIDSYVRRLVDRHIHHVRKFGTEFCDRWEWGECQEQPTSSSAKKAAHGKTVWKYSKRAMEAYTSAEVHTVKRRVPRALIVSLVALLMIPLLVWFAIHHIRGAAPPPSAGASPFPAHASSSPSSAGKAAPVETPQDWVKKQTPRVAGIPWSAPVFDKLSVQAQPELYCASWKPREHPEQERCACYSEQGTHVDVPGALCLQVAKNGIYNPFRKPLDDSPSSSLGKHPGQPMPSASPAPGGPAVVAASVSGIPAPQDKQPGVGDQYTPPEYGHWNPDAFGASSK